MSAGYAYLDTSCLVAIAFDEPGAGDLAQRLDGFDELFSSNLLEAELRAAFVREEVPMDPGFVEPISWILPDRPLGPEIAQALSIGYLRGADLWHLACALYVVERPGSLTFLTRDDRQRDVADRLGFPA